MRFLSLVFSWAFIALSAQADDQYIIEIVKQPEQPWRLQQLTATDGPQGLRLHGHLTATSRHFNLPRGHLDIAVYSPSRELLAESSALPIASMLPLNSKRRGGMPFTIDLEQQLPGQSRIRVAFHAEVEQTTVQPKHCVNIAR